MVFMKKGKTPLERLINMYGAHKGPVRSIHRNPVFIKNFMSCGDYHLRIFAEDCRESGIMWTAPSVCQKVHFTSLMIMMMRLMIKTSVF